jgi:hypothetical protein
MFNQQPLDVTMNYLDLVSIYHDCVLRIPGRMRQDRRAWRKIEWILSHMNVQRNQGARYLIVTLSLGSKTQRVIDGSGQ